MTLTIFHASSGMAAMRWIPLLALAALTGCSSVKSLAPVGAKPAKIDAAEWVGDWAPISSEGIGKRKEVLRIERIEGRGSELLVRAVEDEKVKPLTLILREMASSDGSETWTVGNILEQEAESGDHPPGGEEKIKGPPTYYWARVKKDGARILVWVPDSGAFSKLVRAGKLPGKLDEEDDDTLLLDALSPAHESLIVDEAAGLFSWSEPMVWTRLPGGELSE